MDCCICWADVGLSTTISVVLVLLTYGVLYSLKPKLRIDSAEYDGSSLRIVVTNQGCSNAVNIRIEVCAYDDKDKNNGKSYHFKLDHSDFLILPGKGRDKDNKKVYKAFELADSAKRYYDSPAELVTKIRKGEFRLRVRLHSYHAFSGFGKAEERVFDTV